MLETKRALLDCRHYTNAQKAAKHPFTKGAKLEGLLNVLAPEPPGMASGKATQIIMNNSG